MLISEYVDHWSRSNLITYEDASLEMLHLPGTTKDFLREIGLPLPRRNIGLWKIDWVTRSNSNHLDAQLQLIANNNGLPRFYMYNCGDGAIFYDKNIPSLMTSSPVNSSIIMFAFCLTALDKRRGLRYDDPNYRNIVGDFEKELFDIDPQVMQDDNSLWPNEIFNWRVEGGIEG